VRSARVNEALDPHVMGPLHLAGLCERERGGGGGRRERKPRAKEIRTKNKDKAVCIQTSI